MNMSREKCFTSLKNCEFYLMIPQIFHSSSINDFVNFPDFDLVIELSFRG
jgi:hypothetical protein